MSYSAALRGPSTFETEPKMGDTIAITDTSALSIVPSNTEVDDNEVGEISTPNTVATTPELTTQAEDIQPEKQAAINSRTPRKLPRSVLPEEEKMWVDENPAVRSQMPAPYLVWCLLNRHTIWEKHSSTEHTKVFTRYV